MKVEKYFCVCLCVFVHNAKGDWRIYHRELSSRLPQDITDTELKCLRDLLKKNK